MPWNWSLTCYLNGVLNEKRAQGKQVDAAPLRPEVLSPWTVTPLAPPPYPTQQLSLSSPLATQPVGIFRRFRLLGSIPAGKANFFLKI